MHLVTTDLAHSLCNVNDKVKQILLKNTGGLFYFYFGAASGRASSMVCPLRPKSGRASALPAYSLEFAG